MSIDQLAYLNDLIESGGEITIGSIGPFEGATAVDESSCLAMLARKSGETLSELLIRLDDAIQKAIEEDEFIDEIN
ncbi:hypothetical protein [Endozoicomonas sp. YOMI1]|uniref:hypothetical protein n=1 Tax=Endozoicomonas sp. YOMI1 TaxID=2828739 RepID=UPI0021475E34|nr:hypothetical protein [Endozoicomonas sp. YOMI1]